MDRKSIWSRNPSGPGWDLKTPDTLTPMNPTRVRNWCFTLNNYTSDDIDSIKAINCRYLIFGKEVGASGTPHLQGYIEFDKSVRFSYVKKLFPKAHLEPRTKPREANIKYCKKEGDFFERHGEPLSGKNAEGLDWDPKEGKYYWNGEEISENEYHLRKYSTDTERFCWIGRNRLGVVHETSFMRRLRHRGIGENNAVDHWTGWISNLELFNKLAAEWGLPSFNEQLGW